MTSKSCQKSKLVIFAKCAPMTPCLPLAQPLDMTLEKTNKQKKQQKQKQKKQKQKQKQKNKKTKKKRGCARF